MSDHESWRDTLAAKMATLPLSVVRQLLHQVATNIANDEQATVEPYGPYVARHLGALFARLDTLEGEAEAMRGLLPKGEVPAVPLGREMYVVKTEQRIAYGDPFLSDTDSPLNPALYDTGLEGAVYAQDATGIVQQHIGDAYARWQDTTPV